MEFQILPGPSMRERTTLRLGGRVQAEVVLSCEPHDLEGPERLPELLRSLGGRALALGRGSNILAREGELDLVLVRLRQKPEPRLEQMADGQGLVVAPAGMSLPRMLHWLAARGLSGLEGLAGVPGTVGGAVAMNAGSFGSVFGDRLQRVLVFGEAGAEWIGSAGFETGYRHFQLRDRRGFFLVAAAELLLVPGRTQDIRSAMRANLARKRATQPITAWSAGCAFKNPAPEAPAGMLLERAGFKGREHGGMTFSAMHANFLVNTGRGHSDAALELIEMAREKVLEQSGYELELEVKLCP
jgi:UDP-N-acetylmuramate dehydrogenase